MNNSTCIDGQIYGKVAVLMGGLSAEREISLISGSAVLQALQTAGIDAHGVDTADRHLHDILVGGGFSRAFIALHGRGGEDGVIQGLLECIGLPYTGSGVLGSALAMDKLRSKQVWQSAGLPTPAFAVLSSAADVVRVKECLQYPAMVKPSHEGSSIGISKVDDADGLMAAWRLAAQYDECVIAEQWVEGVEYTAGILGDDVLPLICLETPNTFYDYAAKYEADTTRYLIPCGLPSGQETELQAMAQAAFAAVGATGWGRVDFMLDTAGQPGLIDINTVPGLTDHSLMPMAASAAGMDFGRLVCRILDTSLRAEPGMGKEAGCA
ncbi:MAG: D-alanine--D-alanine ligase [Pseudomonadota bacterium]